MTETILQINGIPLVPQSARGLTESIEPIAEAVSLRRTVNGKLINVAAPAYRKYRATITCGDFNAPALDGVFPGAVVTVDCVSEFSTEGSPERPVVAGSERTAGGVTYYRPQLTMLVSNYSTQTDEYGAAVSWTLELEEE